MCCARQLPAPEPVSCGRGPGGPGGPGSRPSGGRSGAEECGRARGKAARLRRLLGFLPLLSHERLSSVSWRCWRRVFQNLMEMFWVVACCEEKKRVVQHLAHTLEPDGSDSEDSTVHSFSQLVHCFDFVRRATAFRCAEHCLSISRESHSHRTKRAKLPAFHPRFRDSQSRNRRVRSKRRVCLQQTARWCKCISLFDL